MNIWASMIQALRGDNIAENDAKALHILDVELRRAAQTLAESKDELAALMAQEKLAATTAQELADAIAQHEQHAIAALDAGNDASAIEWAEKIAALETDAEHQQQLWQQYQQSVKQIQSSVNRAQLNLKSLKQQVATIKATESVQRAQASIAERHGQVGFANKSAQASLALLKERQAEKAARINAEQSTDDEQRKDLLRQQLVDAGIHSASQPASDILARLKKQKAKE